MVNTAFLGRGNMNKGCLPWPFSFIQMCCREDWIIGVSKYRQCFILAKCKRFIQPTQSLFHATSGHTTNSKHWTQRHTAKPRANFIMSSHYAWTDFLFLQIFPSLDKELGGINQFWVLSTTGMRENNTLHSHHRKTPAGFFFSCPATHLPIINKTHMSSDITQVSHVLWNV